MICIICKRDIYGKKLTTEHIFPEAIGGTITIKPPCALRGTGETRVSPDLFPLFQDPLYKDKATPNFGDS